MGQLEKTVASLAGLPQQVQELSTQFLQFRQEMRTDISGIRGEMHGIRDELRGAMASVHHDLAKIILASQAQTRSVHEDLVERIKLLGEGLKAPSAEPPSDGTRVSE